MLSTELHAWGAAQVGKVCALFGQVLRSKINSRVVASSSCILARDPIRQALLGGNSPFTEERGFVRDQRSHNARGQEPVGRRQGTAGVTTTSARNLSGRYLSEMNSPIMDQISSVECQLST